MTAPRPTGSIDIWNFVDNITGTTVRKWIRDSWARRKIVALQQAVSSIVVPTKTSDLTNDSGYITRADIPPGAVPSSTTPLMDGTAAVGTENAFARGDHRHPTDTTRQAALSTTQMAAVNSGVTAAKVQAWDGITVPTKTSDLMNDSDFQTGTQVGNAISAEAGLMVPYGYCTTGASTVAKTVTVSPAITELTAGLCIAVKFQYANTSTNPTLNVNGLGAKAIKRYGTTAAGTSAASNWNANSIVMLMYDGTYWMLVDFNNTTYSGMTDAEYQAGTSTTNRLITPARLKAAIELHAPVQSVNGQDGDVTIAVPTKTSDLTNDSGFITSVPVTSVNTKTGAVTLNASDVGALPSSTVIPTKTSDLTNDSGYITSAPVQSVNGQTGTVSLSASDVGALPSSTVIPSATSDLTNDSGFITASSVPSASSATPAMDGTASAGSSTAWARGDHRHPTDTSRQAALSSTQLAAVNSGVTAAKVQEWDAIEVPTKTSELTNDSGFITSVPVTSVNGQTGAVTVTVPTKTSDLTNDSGFITSIPVQSVNGQTGAVDLDAADVGALPDSTVIPSKTSQLTNDSGFITSAPVTSVNGKTGAVALDASDVGANSNKSGANGGTLIPNGSDLDTYTTPGTYYVSNSSAAATIVHTPSRVSGFKLFVEGSYYSNYIAQYMLTSARLYFRTRNGSSGWLPWKQWGNGGVVSVKGNQTGQTGKWTGTIVLPELYDGLTIAYYLPYAVPSSTNVSLQLTLSDGTVTDEIPVYITGNTRATTQYEAGSTVLLTYWSAGAISIAGTATSEARWTRADYSADYSVATDSANGLMSAADKAKIDNDFAVNDPSVLCTVTPIEPTLDAGANYDSFGGCWYYKIGHRVRVHIGVSGLTANTTTTLWILPQGYRPYSGIAFTGQSSVYSNYARCRVLENGEVRVNAVSTYAVAYIEFDAFA